MYKNYLVLFIFLIVFIIFYLINNHLNKYEHFLNIYQYINDGFNHKIKENTKDITISNKFKNFDNIFLKNIYLSYNEKSDKFEFYQLNYNHKLFMKINVKKDKSNFDILDLNNNLMGNLKNRHHNQYIIDLNKLYKNDYIFSVMNNYQQIKIFNHFEYNIYYLKKNDDNLKKYKLYLFDEEIGYINNEHKNYKFFIKKDYLKDVNLFCYALIIIISNNQI